MRRPLNVPSSLRGAGMQPGNSISFMTSSAVRREISREALIKSLSDFILVFLFNARNKSTRIASYLRRLMTQHWIKIHMKFDSAN